LTAGPIAHAARRRCSSFAWRRALNHESSGAPRAGVCGLLLPVDDDDDDDDDDGHVLARSRLSPTL
jgi:hypothetical protein